MMVRPPYPPRSRPLIRLRTGLTAVAAGLSLIGGAAHAQTATSAGESKQPDSAVMTGDKLPTEHLTGDWGGLRGRWLDKGVDLDLSYESETAAVVSGGARRGTDYAHSINLKADIDMAKLAGLSGFSLHGALVERAGRNASADFLHEHLNQVQEIYGSGGDVAAHLSYLYGEQKIFGGALDIEGGRLDVGQDFAASPLYCEFMTLSVCPSPRSLTVQTGFTTFPSSTWGGRVKVTPRSAVAVQVGAYEVRPQFGGRSGFDWSTDHTTGAFVPVELDFTPQWGGQRLIGHYKLGATYDTSRYPQLLTATPGAERRGRISVYVLADQMLVRTGQTGTDGVILFGGYAHADPRTAVISGLGFIGLLANGVVPGRKADSVGVQVTHLDVSHKLTTAQEIEAQLDQPLSSGLGDVPAPAGVQTSQTVLEGRYDIHLAKGVHAMPDVQYVMHPDATTRDRNATVLSLRLSLDL